VRFCDLNWMQLEEYLGGDDRVVLPVGSTEQHAYLSLETDNIIAERLAVEAAEPLGVPVLPVLAYGVTDFDDFPGSPTLSPETFGAVVRDILDSLQWQGFRRFVIANSHGGNLPEHVLLDDWTAEYNNVEALWHDVWEGRPDELAAEIDSEYAHASWSENFPWTRLPGVEMPSDTKPPFVPPENNEPGAWREALGDGSFGGPYQRPDEDVLRVWGAAVEQLRERLATGWALSRQIRG
jgi:creatinine amidohydrolase